MRSLVLIVLSLVCTVSAWDEEDFEVFDAVEEVNENFYDLLQVKQDASPAEIKAAFKKLTLKLHPDKNDAPDADEKFRNLVTVHLVLKDPSKREKYDLVLKNGLPNWRSALYYYRHVRKIGLAEGAVILFILLTLGQYAVGWAAYVEKRFTAESILNSRGKKHSKKSGFDAGLAEILEQLPKPSIKDTLPFQIPRFLWWLVTAIPRGIEEYKQMKKEREEEARRQAKREEEERRREVREAAAAAEAKEKGARRRRAFLPRARDPPAGLLDPGHEPDMPPENKVPPVVSGGLWTDEDLAELVRLVKKYPGGTADRWDTIAGFMRRPVAEVTHMAAKMKDTRYKVPGQEPEPVIVEQPKKVKTRKVEETGGGAWSQNQQKALEAALAKHPKGGAGDRWQKIAAAVQGKTKEECMQRCKYLSDLVRKQKQKEEEEKEEKEPVVEEPLIQDEQSDQELEIKKKGRKGKKQRRKKFESSEEEITDPDSE